MKKIIGIILGIILLILLSPLLIALFVWLIAFLSVGIATIGLAWPGWVYFILILILGALIYYIFFE